MNKAVKSYLNPNDRFATRMKASLKKNQEEEGSDDIKVEQTDQEELFVDKRNLNLNGTTRTG